MYLVDYNTVKSFDEQRRGRSLNRYRENRQDVVDSFRLPPAPVEADVIELVFPLGCEITEMGA